MKEAPSAMTMLHHIPIAPKKRGKTMTETSPITRVLTKDIIAEIMPLLRAVKKLEKNIENPQKRKCIEKMRKAKVVKSNRA